MVSRFQTLSTHLYNKATLTHSLNSPTHSLTSPRSQAIQMLMYFPKSYPINNTLKLNFNITLFIVSTLVQNLLILMFQKKSKKFTLFVSSNKLVFKTANIYFQFTFSLIFGLQRLQQFVEFLHEWAMTFPKTFFFKILLQIFFKKWMPKCKNELAFVIISVSFAITAK